MIKHKEENNEKLICLNTMNGQYLEAYSITLEPSRYFDIKKKIYLL